MIRRTHISIAIVVLALAVGCAGTGEGLDQNGRPIAETVSASLIADFASIQSNVFTPLCAAGESAPQLI